MMYVEFEKCNGCGECLEICSVEAISLNAGKAMIDPDTCLVCGSCIQACPQGAISQAELLAPCKPIDIQPVEVQTASLVPTSSTDGRLVWVGPVLSFIGHEIVPRLADALIAALDRRLSISVSSLAVDNHPMLNPDVVGRRRTRRRRRRGGVNSLHP
jgi:NAD-dependent dihydropyrimidine dehydrogenase PreA subunit